VAGSTNKHTDWVGAGITVEANFAAGGGSYGKGRVISYTDRPTVTIEREDGTRFSWIADLCMTEGGACNGPSGCTIDDDGNCDC
jgi:hypothetical protein